MRIEFTITSLLLIILLGSSTVALAYPTGAIGPKNNTTTEFVLGWEETFDLDLRGTLLNLFGVIEVDAYVDIGFWAGCIMPLCFNVFAPEWVTPDAAFGIDVYPEGISGGKVGFNAGASTGITLHVAGFEFPFSIGRDLDLTTELITPIGTSSCEPMEGRILLGELDISLAGISIVKVAAYFGIEVEILFHGVAVSIVRIDGDSLLDSRASTVYWDQENSKYTGNVRTVLPSFSDSINVTLENACYALNGISISLSSVFLEFEAFDWEPLRLNLTIGFPLYNFYSPMPTFETGSQVYDYMHSLSYSNLSIDPVGIYLDSSASIGPLTPFDVTLLWFVVPMSIFMTVVLLITKD